jgi:RNA polymerase sigma factor (sigma-70 family)
MSVLSGRTEAMANADLGSVLDHIRRLAGRDGSDAELLQDFAARHEEGAFAAIVQRYGRLVLGVCRRVLGNVHDAEDAFQATFLVLARSAASIGKGEALPGWLHGVAYHMASKARRSAVRRRNHEMRARGAGLPTAPPQDKPQSELALRELQAILDEEVRRLPAIYRTPFVLCCLEGQSKAEAARRLGWKEGTVSGRLARARRRLQQRLVARGVSLSAALAAVALAPGATRAAVSTGLAAATAHAAAHYAAGKTLFPDMVSPHVAQLIHGANPAMSLTTGKMALFLFVGLFALGTGALLLRSQAAAPPPPDPGLALARADAAPKEEPATAKPAADAMVKVSGRVLDPDGKPASGARVYWPRLLKDPPGSIDDIALTARATTGADGRFQFDLAPKELWREWSIPVIAHKEGFGVAGAELPKSGPPADLTLRLVSDSPVRGRVLDTQGKPVAGARVQVVGVLVPRKGRLDDFLATWKHEWQMAGTQTGDNLHLPLGSLLRTPPTDRDGRFAFAGAGAERIVLLQVSGPAIAQDTVYVVNRPGFDAAALNKAVQENIPEQLRIPGQPPLLYRPSFDYIAEPTRRIEGVVREVGSGNPIPGVHVNALTGYNRGSQAVSDKQGRYHLDGLPKLKEYSLHASPPGGSAFIPRSVRVPDQPGLQLIPYDLELARGVVVSGRIIDRVTGKGVQSGMRFVPLPDNKYFGKPGYDSYRAERLMTPTDAEGRFRLVTIPGPSVLLAQVHHSDVKVAGQSLNPFKQAVFDANDRKRVGLKDDGDGTRYFNSANGIEFLGLEHACKVLDLQENSGPLTQDLFVERGLTRSINLEDAEGKPLSGVMVGGITASWPNAVRLDSASCTIYALDPTHPRQLVFLHSGRNLAGTLKLRGDEKETPTVRLAPAGTVTGQLLDQDGQPIAGAEIDLSFSGGAANELYRQLGLTRAPIRTDNAGRFRVEGVIPSLKFILSMHKGREYYFPEPRETAKQVESGKTLDLGGFRTKGRKL